MSWLIGVLALTGWALVLVLLALLPGRARRKAIQDALRLRSHVEPYLRRRAAEIEDVAPLPATSPSHLPSEIVDTICALADRLSEHERSQVTQGDTLDMAVSDTMPIPPGLR